MTSRMKLALIQVQDPRVLRLVLIGATLVLALISQVVPGAETVYACPATGCGSCAGGD